MKIKVANEYDKVKLNNLLVNAYQTSTGMKLNDSSFLLWENTKEKGIVLCVENDKGEIISTMRGSIVTNKSELERIYDIKVNSKLNYPILLNYRGATSFEYRNKGLTKFLRILFLQFSLKNKINHIAVTMQEDASRVKLLKEMGFHFEFADISKRKESSFNNSSRAVFGLLDKSSFENALKIANENLQSDLSQFEFDESVKKLLC